MSFFSKPKKKGPVNISVTNNSWSVSGNSLSNKVAPSEPNYMNPLPRTMYFAKFIIPATKDNNLIGATETHMATWTKMFPDIKHAMLYQSTRYDNSISPLQPAFYTEEDRDTFDAWMTNYQKKFGLDTFNDHGLPPPIDGHYPYVVRDRDTGSETHHDLWLWILTNCIGEARYSDKFWYFEKEEDAVLFTMGH